MTSAARRKRIGPCSRQLVALVMLLLLAEQAHAQPSREEAAALFREGSASFARGDYRAAALAFDAAYRGDPQGASAYNAALAWDATGEAADRARAADAYDAAGVRGGIEPSELAHARERLQALERELGRVDVSGPENAKASLGHVQEAALPLRIHLAPGNYELRVVFPGDRIATRAVNVAAGTTVTLAMEAPTAPPAPKPKPRLPIARDEPPPADDPTLLVLGVVGLTSGALAAGAAIGLGVAALDARDEYFASNFLRDDLYDRARTLRTWTNVVWAGAGVLGVAGGVLLIVALVQEPPKTSGRSARLVAAPGGFGVGAEF